MRRGRLLVGLVRLVVVKHGVNVRRSTPRLLRRRRIIARHDGCIGVFAHFESILEPLGRLGRRGRWFASYPGHYVCTKYVCPRIGCGLCVCEYY